MGLVEALTALLAGYASQTVSVAFVDLQTGEAVSLHAHERMHAASMMKLPVLLEAHRRAAEGSLRLDEPVSIVNDFVSIADGSHFVVDSKDDSDDWVYAQLGKQVPFGKLLERMIVRSSNLATNLVLARLHAAAVTALCERLGARETHILRGVEDGKAHARGLDNTTTASDLRLLLRALAEGGAPGSAEMIALLERQEYNEGIPAALPAGTRVAHKTGSITGVYHDAALVLPRARKPYVLVVLTRGFEQEADAVAAVRKVSRLVWDHVASAASTIP